MRLSEQYHRELCNACKVNLVRHTTKAKQPKMKFRGLVHLFIALLALYGAATIVRQLVGPEPADIRSTEVSR